MKTARQDAWALGSSDSLYPTILSPTDMAAEHATVLVSISMSIGFLSIMQCL